MRYKVKTKDCHLIVKAKTSWGEEIDTKAIDAFARIYLRGFLKPSLINKNTIEYTGPVGISLAERLKKPMSKRDFLFVMEQIVVAVQKIGNNNLPLHWVVLDKQYVYINDITKEIQFLYVPSSKATGNPGVMEFVESIVYSVTPAAEKDTEFVSRFIYFLKNRKSFEPEAVEMYISKEDRSVVNTIKKQNVGQSGFMTSKQKSYYDHYENRGGEADSTELRDERNESSRVSNEADCDATGLLDETNYDATGWGAETDYKVTAAARETSYEATGLLIETDCAASDWVDERNYEATGWSDKADYEATGLLNETACEAADWADERNYEATGWADQSDYDATGLLIDADRQRNEYEEAGTTLLNECQSVHYPKLLRVLNDEIVSINKPVFRIGKEKSYVDYFVINNNAVSRSHADIITRGNRYFVIDLNSKNHTYINNQVIAVQCETEIFDGDRLKLGNEEFIFQVNAQNSTVRACHRCGKTVQGNGKFCSYCGCRID